MADVAVVSEGLKSERANDSGPTWTLNVAPRKRTTRMKTKRVTLRGLNILKSELILDCKFIQ